MIIIENNFEDVQTYDNYVALGSFDGLHIGHLSLIDEVTRIAKKNNGKSMVFTFKNHPRKFINPSNTLKLLMENDDKIKMLEDKGIDIAYFANFNEEFMKITPEEFIKFLCINLNIKGIIVGFNYKFGYKNSGDTKLLKELEKKYEYELHVMDSCTYKDEVISSTRIRKELEAGNVSEASIMLNRPYIIKGEIVHGREIGRMMGFPTANLKYNKDIILPKIGVYYTNVRVNNKIYRGITNIGNNPTVNGKEITLETNILNFDDDIYGKIMEVNFIKKIRDQKKFDSVDDLVNELKNNKLFAEKEEIVVK
ncbi:MULTISPECIES: bifunctional riboflavin kinase/FAD synthetase [Clostridium]|uniref:Riboflavin biosynthesis protein n=1 Tax=Clostridium aquiflavi TaxID=3073603 RepID=A0ABU1EEU3_9CLOT|nr:MULTISPECIES: bifunctional riboflavin kinase/FAD synthetase [unclassified Clostridium]MDR5586882.1 bifunctional riboflavin kinase/FAD synthetase [Clostridium sp. 5N-1]